MYANPQRRNISAPWKQVVCLKLKLYDTSWQSYWLLDEEKREFTMKKYSQRHWNKLEKAVKRALDTLMMQGMMQLLQKKTDKERNRRPRRFLFFQKLRGMVLTIVSFFYIRSNT
jgi:hypothetical protein